MGANRGRRNRADESGNVVLISGSELQRIREKASGQDENLNRSGELTRRLLKERSQERASRWSNTIDGVRRGKEMEFEAKRLREEEERQRIDREEEQFRRKERCKVIERANRLMFDDQDVVKAMKSQMLLSEAMKDHELQIEYKKKFEEMNRRAEEEYFRELNENLDKQKQEEERKALEQWMKNREIAKSLKHQVELVEARRAREQEEEDQEGQMIRQQAIDNLQQEISLAQERRKHEREMNIEYARSNDALKEMRKKEAEQLAEEERKIEQYAEMKRFERERIRQRERDKHEEKLAVRQKLIDRQAAVLKAMKDQSEAKLNREVAEKEKKDHEAEMEKIRRARQLQSEIDRSRKSQINRKNEQREREKQRGLVERQAQLDLFCMLNDEDEAEQRAVCRRREEIRRYQEHQADIRQKEREEQRELEHLEAELFKQTIEEENRMLESYVQNVMSTCKSQGKNSKPLELAANRLLRHSPSRL